MPGMDKAQLKQALTFHHSNFLNLIESIPDKDFHVGIGGKWSTSQQLEHIIKSIGPVRLAFFLPASILKMVFGTSNRPSRSYEGLVEKYLGKLSAGGKAPPRFIPSGQTTEVRANATKLRHLTESLADNVDSFSEKQLDFLLLPHPLLGKLTLREMLYFTIYHVQHHHKQIRL